MHQNYKTVCMLLGTIVLDISCSTLPERPSLGDQGDRAAARNGSQSSTNPDSRLSATYELCLANVGRHCAYAIRLGAARRTATHHVLSFFTSNPPLPPYVLRCIP